MKPTPVILGIVALLGVHAATRYADSEPTPAPVAQATPTPAPQAAPMPAPVAQATPAPAPVAPQASLSARVDALMRGRPVDALEAFKLLSACAHKQAPCGDISPGQIASRRVALYRAAEAGVHGAASLVAMQGPDDYGVAKIDKSDPTYQEWDRHMQKALEAGARTGDGFSLVTMALSAELPMDGSVPDPVRALMYWTALAERAKRSGNPSAKFAEGANRRAKELPPDVAQKAIASGQLLAQSFKPEGEQQ